ncbi:unnamed protein product, partial [Ixodes hexagonus]
MAKGSVLWRRNEFEDDEIWDDSEMIAAYNRAVSKIKDEISRRSRSSSETKPEPPTGWKHGDYCIAVYSGDNLPYEAKIKYIKGKHCTVHYIGYGNEERVLLADLHPSEGRQARLAQQERAKSSSGTSKVDVVTRWRRKWHISKPRRSLARAETIYVTNTPNFPRRIALSDGRFLSARPIGPFRLKNTAIRSKYKPLCVHASQRIPSIPPPPPPAAFSGDIKDNEALSSMLMSWYMSGYHTGFYQ